MPSLREVNLVEHEGDETLREDQGEIGLVLLTLPKGSSLVGLHDECSAGLEKGHIVITNKSWLGMEYIYILCCCISNLLSPIK